MLINTKCKKYSSSQLQFQHLDFSRALLGGSIPQRVLCSTCGACTRFISSRRVCSGPSMGLLFFSASSRKDVHCWIRLYSMNTSTICTQRKKNQRNYPVKSNYEPDAVTPKSFLSQLVQVKHPTPHQPLVIGSVQHVFAHIKG